MADTQGWRDVWEARELPRAASTAQRPASQHGESGLQHVVTEGLIGWGVQEQTGVLESPVQGPCGKALKEGGLEAGNWG